MVPEAEFAARSGSKAADAHAHMLNRLAFERKLRQECVRARWAVRAAVGD